MRKEPKWEFVSTGGSREDGIHNSMIEHFAGNHNYHLAREIIQNSIDAKQDGSTEPVTVVFKLEEFTKKEFPGQSELLEVLNACKKYYKSDKDTQEFIDNALECIKADTIPFLKISDFNTKGLFGNDDDKKGGWYNLVKSTGASSKGEHQGGSFGIGKGAPFAASNLRVVFYSTLKEDSFTKFQGIAELVSHEVDNDVKRGVGSFGFGQGSLNNLKDIPEKFWRKEKTGTDIFIAGYKNEKGWQKDLVQSVLRNFWYAISKNDLIVRVEKDEINQENLEKYLSHHFINEPFKDYVEPTGNPLQYYLAVKNGKPFEAKLPTLGNVKFYFYQTEEHLNYVSMLRKSHMVIYSRRFNFPGNYAGVFICDDDKGNKELRKMEPPAHDKWIPERNKEKGPKAMEEIISFVRDCLDQMKITKTSGVLDIPELYKYLPYDEGEDAGEGNGVSQYTGEESEEESSKKIQKKEVFEVPAVISPFKVSVINNPDIGDGNGSGSGSRGGGSSRTDSSGSGSGKKKSFKKEEVETRSFLSGRTGNSLEYIVLIKSNVKEKCYLKLTAIGEEGSEKLKITKVIDASGYALHFSGNIIHGIYLEGGKETKMNVTIESPIKYSLKIDAYALQ
ncbi:MAG TPA: hypothetical protein VG847_13040 [Chitinophagaceae bacterium]|nr:hypothetical protein [Chitinophagaceae bacterium]